MTQITLRSYMEAKVAHEKIKSFICFEMLKEG